MKALNQANFEQKSAQIYVTRAPNINKPWRGIMRFGVHAWPCIIGKGGMAALKFEGDLKTPIGQHMLGNMWCRKERINRHKFSVLNSNLAQAQPIQKHQLWCDDLSSPNYNTALTEPFKGSHEKLQRSDRLYDVIIETHWNYWPRSRNRGSAIFLHIAPKTGESEVAENPKNGNIGGTAGCIALEPKHFAKLIILLKNTPKTCINIVGS